MSLSDLSLSRRHLIGAGAAGALLSPMPVLASQRPGSSAIDQFILERMEAKGIPGAGVAVVHGGDVVTQKGYGKASLEFDVAATDRTVFPLASSSKIFSGLTAGILADRGLLDLDGSIRDYLPELPESHAPIRVWHLLSHTSGLNGPGDNPAYVAELASRERREAYVGDLKLEFFTPAEIIAYGADVSPRGPAGSGWRYSQYPYFLFGQIVERVTGAPYTEFLTRAIFQPLGITQTVGGDHRTFIPGHRSTNYTRQFGPFQNFALRYTPTYWTAAGMNSTAADMARLFAGFEPGRIMSAAQLERLWTPVRLNDGQEVAYGLGFDLASVEAGRSAGHEGGGCSYVRWWPEHRLGVAILFNYSGSLEDGIEQRLAGQILGG